MLRTGKTSAIVAGTASLRGTPQAAFAKLADPAGKTKLDRHPGAGLRSLLSRQPCTHQPAIIPLRSSVGESGNHVIALARRLQGTSPDAPTKSRELRGSVVMQECFRDIHTTHIVRDPPVIYSGRTGNPETLCWK